MKYPTLYRTVQIDGLSIFYREAGPKDVPTLLLLHGLPSSSRRLGNALPGLESNLDQGATMSPRSTTLAKFSLVFLRLALGIAFLSAVADRLGVWGAYGQPNVSWGDYARFVAYKAKLNWFLPAAMIPTLAVATAAETIFGLLLS